MVRELSRRELISHAGVCWGAAALATLAENSLSPSLAAEPDQRSGAEPFGYSLNTGTLRGQKLPLNALVDVASKAGYQAIEPWVEEIRRYAESGGSLADLKKQAQDRGIRVVDAIGFADWISDDDDKRQAGLEQMRREMELVAQIGGIRIAAPPSGAYNTAVDLRKVAERYRKVLELGRSLGIVAQLELWGGAKTLSRLGEIAFVTVEADDPDACALLDAFHLYKGGNDFAGLRMLNGGTMHVFHINDYPADPPREKVTDAHRVYPGDGSAPLSLILKTLHSTGFRGFLSLELFNRDYWQQDPLEVARTGLAKVRAAVAEALAS